MTAGYNGVGLFTKDAVRNVCDHSRGVPRSINTLCFSAMLLGFAENVKSIDDLIVKEAARDLDLDNLLSDVYQTQPTVASLGEGKLQSNRETKPRELDNPGKGASGAADNVGAAESRQGFFEESQAHTAARTDSTVVAPTVNSMAKLQDSSLQVVEETGTPCPPPQSKTRDGTKHSTNSMWAKTISLTAIVAITGVLALVLVAKFPSQGRAQADPNGSGLTGFIGFNPWHSASTETLASTPDAPSTPTKSAPAASNGPRNADSNELDDVTVRKFPGDSNVTPRTSGNGQQLETIFFEQDSSVIDSGYRSSLQHIADALAENPNVGAILEGHTDSIGPESYNLNLSSHRAIAVPVRNALVNDLHVSASRLTAIGAGSESRALPNSSAAGGAHNRRVEVRLVVLSE